MRAECIHERPGQQCRTEEEAAAGDEAANFVSTIIDCDESMAKLEVRLESLKVRKGKFIQAKVLMKYNYSNLIPSQTVRLPKLEVPSFNGDILKWKEFWESSKSSIHNNPSLSNTDNFNYEYLTFKLEDEAKWCI